jgi:hypothetical protein
LGFWALTGFAGEWTDDRPSEPGWDRLIAFNGKIFPGFATPRQDSDGWAFKVERRPEYDGPASFGGYSGGGLWHSLITKNEEGQIGLKTIILSGVAYYQTGFQNDANIIYCNGYTHIYGFIADVLAV